MTSPTTDTSREAFASLNFELESTKPIGEHFALCEKRDKMISALLSERDAALLREKSLKDNTEELRQLRRVFKDTADKYSNLSDRYADLTEKLIAERVERDALRDQLAAARNEALEEVFNHFEPDELDGESTRGHCEYAQREICALKSTTAAPREVTVQEAARVNPDAVHALSNYQQADMDGITVLVSRQAIEECLHALRALAKEEQSDG